VYTLYRREKIKMTSDYKEFEAKSVDEAIVAAMREFRVPFEELDIKVISEGSKGLFGLMGQKNAKIMARRLNSEAEDELKPRQVSEVEQQSPDDEDGTGSMETLNKDRETMLKANEMLTRILRLMHIDAESKINTANNYIEITGKGIGIIIGKHGKTLDALQFLLNRMVNKGLENSTRIRIDAQGYRKRHVEHLKSIAIKLGQKVKRTGQAISLEKMNPYDRRIVHLALKDDKRVDTKSVGEGLYKSIVISPRKASKS